MKSAGPDRPLSIAKIPGRVLFSKNMHRLSKLAHTIMTKPADFTNWRQLYRRWLCA